MTKVYDEDGSNLSRYILQTESAARELYHCSPVLHCDVDHPRCQSNIRLSQYCWLNVSTSWFLFLVYAISHYT